MKTFKQYLYEACDVDKEVTRSDLKALERQLDAMWKVLKIDIEFPGHFFDRINDPRNDKQITVCDVFDLFKKLFGKSGKKISNQVFKIKTGKDFQAVAKDINTNVNIPFTLEWNPRSEEMELITKTIIRKKNFKSASDDKKFEV